MRCKIGVSILSKLESLMDLAKFSSINFKKKFTAVKMHLGEPGNLSFLRPNFAKTVVDKIKGLGGRPFLTDCGTLYVGRRNDALSHLEAAWENGFGPLSAGCPILIADGLRGNDDYEVTVENGELVKTALIGRAIMDADIVISLSHFKGHEQTGFGGAIKNLGMGSGSKAGKMIMHNDGKPTVEADVCQSCGQCRLNCAHEAIKFKNRKAFINIDKCAGCGRCIGACNYNAISVAWDSANDSLNKKMAEYAKAVVQNRPNFHINVVNQVSPFCDCHFENDAAVVPDIGIFLGFDPVAVDAASIDAVNKASTLAGTIVDEIKDPGGDLFTKIHPTTDWRSQLEHAEKIGLGLRAYELITMES
jgi:uncharacterized Fe-S center protein